jgi:hypothetical protein
VRGDLALRTRLILRPRGIIGLVTTVAGMVAIVSLYLPWYEIRAEISMLGETRSRVVATLAGWEAHPWLWGVGLIGLAAVVIGLLVALDRAPPKTSSAVLGLATMLALLAGVSALVIPSAERFAAGGEIAELTALSQRLPDDVGIALEISVAGGTWVALAVTALLILAAAGLKGR